MGQVVRRAVQVSPHTCLFGERHDSAELMPGKNLEDLVSISVNDLKNNSRSQILFPFHASLS